MTGGKSLLRFAAAVGALTIASISPAAATCGEVVTLDTHDGTTTRYSLAGMSADASVALVLLPGGGGNLKLKDNGCPRRYKGNSLVRKQALFHGAGLVTALVDAPSDRQGEDGLGGFRVIADHANDIGKVIADVRRRTGLPVWLAGTSRGTISATNAAARLLGPAAPDGLVLTSPLTSGRDRAFKLWVADTVFSNDLHEIKIPVLVVVHADDKCVRTPPNLGARIIRKTNGLRGQAVTVTGGAGWDGGESLKACKGRSPHGFIGQEDEVAAGIVRFIGGGAY